MSANVKNETRAEVSEHHADLHKKVKEQRQQPVAPPPLPAAPQHTVVGLNCFNSTAKISNANWETKLQEEIIVNEGDSIFVKNAYIDTRNQTSQNILIEEDTIIEMEFFFYYVNRGGSNVPSVYQDYATGNTPNPLITQQLRACEISQWLSSNNPPTNTTEVTHLNGLPFVVIAAPTGGSISQNETIANLAPVTETIYYAPVTFPAGADQAATDYIDSITEKQRRLNPMAFIMPQGIYAADGMPYLLQMVVPNNTIPPNGDEGQTIFVIAEVGQPLVDGFTGIVTYSANPPQPNQTIVDANIETWAAAADGDSFIQVALTIKWNQNTGKYLATGHVTCFGIAVGQTFTILGSNFPDGVDGLNDCIITVATVGAPPQPPNGGSPPLAALTFTTQGALGAPPPPNPLYKAPDRLVPFTKKWKMLIPAGSYSPDFLATTVSKGMSIQKQKIQRNYLPQGSTTGPLLNTLITPTQLVNGQFPLTQGVLPDQKEQFLGYLPNLPCGSWDTSAPDGAYYYQPNLYYASKNPKSYPDPPVSNFNNPPYDPDFNNPALIDGDDMSFIFRPYAFTNLFPLSTTDMGYNNTNRLPFPSGNTPLLTQVPNFRLSLNDSNFQTYNSMPIGEPRQPIATLPFDPVIDMIYTPFLTDVNSPFYWLSEAIFDPTDAALNPPYQGPDMNYGIRPIISTMNMVTDITSEGDLFGYSKLFVIPDITTPLVGATEMSLTWNDEGSNLFALPFLHNPLYSKPDPTTDETQASVAKMPSSYCFGQTPTHLVQGMVQCDRQSGILLKSMTSKTRSGKNGLFWEKLGFVPEKICVKVDASGNPICNYRTFISKTTGGFSGTANCYNPAYNVRGSAEICYGAAEDMYSIGGWYSNSNPSNPFPLADEYNFIQNFNTIYYTVENTTSIYASGQPLNDNDTGHVLIELQAWDLGWCNENDKKQIKSIVSNYFVSANSFVSQIGPESFQYYHIGSSLTVGTVKCRILNPKTMEEYPLLGPNSSIYVQFIRQPTQANMITGISL
tara:strand:- start:5670 stop:8717 length:3048 start_codon:yes stop_codon:yes gene_type:complete